MDPENIQTTQPTTPPSVQPSPVIQPVPPIPQKPGSKLPLILGLIVFILISGGILLAKTGNFSQLAPQPIPTPIPTQIPVPTPTPDPTANWKSFAGPETQYQIKYPENWNFIGKSQGCGPVFSPVKEQDLFSSAWLTICGPYVNAWETPEKLAIQSAGKKTVLQKETIKIDGHNGVKQTLKEEGNNYSIEIFIEGIKSNNMNSTGTLGVYIYNRDGLNPGKYQEVFNQILSTFKFTDQNQTNGIENWKTYTNQQYKFSVKAPAEIFKEQDNKQAGQFQVFVETTDMNLVLDIYKLQQYDVEHYLNSKLEETKIINSLSWDILTNPGYCDAGSCGKPFLVYQTIKSNYRYAFVFNNTETKTQLQEQIVSTFRFD